MLTRKSSKGKKTKMNNIQENEQDISESSLRFKILKKHQPNIKDSKMGESRRRTLEGEQSSMAPGFHDLQKSFMQEVEDENEAITDGNYILSMLEETFDIPSAASSLMNNMNINVVIKENQDFHDKRDRKSKATVSSGWDSCHSESSVTSCAKKSQKTKSNVGNHHTLMPPKRHRRMRCVEAEFDLTETNCDWETIEKIFDEAEIFSYRCENELNDKGVPKKVTVIGSRKNVSLLPVMLGKYLKESTSREQVGFSPSASTVESSISSKAPGKVESASRYSSENSSSQATPGTSMSNMSNLIQAVKSAQDLMLRNVNRAVVLMPVTETNKVINAVAALSTELAVHIVNFQQILNGMFLNQQIGIMSPEGEAVCSLEVDQSSNAAPEEEEDCKKESNAGDIVALEKAVSLVRILKEKLDQCNIVSLHGKPACEKGNKNSVTSFKSEELSTEGSHSCKSHKNIIHLKQHFEQKLDQSYIRLPENEVTKKNELNPFVLKTKLPSKQKLEQNTGQSWISSPKTEIPLQESVQSRISSPINEIPLQESVQNDMASYSNASFKQESFPSVLMSPNSEALPEQEFYRRGCMSESETSFKLKSIRRHFMSPKSEASFKSESGHSDFTSPKSATSPKQESNGTDFVSPRRGTSPMQESNLTDFISPRSGTSPMQASNPTDFVSPKSATSPKQESNRTDFVSPKSATSPMQESNHSAFVLPKCELSSSDSKQKSNQKSDQSCIKSPRIKTVSLQETETSDVPSVKHEASFKQISESCDITSPKNETLPAQKFAPVKDKSEVKVTTSGISSLSTDEEWPEKTFNDAISAGILKPASLNSQSEASTIECVTSLESANKSVKSLSSSTLISGDSCFEQTPKVEDTKLRYVMSHCGPVPSKFEVKFEENVKCDIVKNSPEWSIRFSEAIPKHEGDSDAFAKCEGDETGFGKQHIGEEKDICFSATGRHFDLEFVKDLDFLKVSSTVCGYGKTRKI